jgi:hypothetical protein
MWEMPIVSQAYMYSVSLLARGHGVQASEGFNFFPNDCATKGRVPVGCDFSRKVEGTLAKTAHKSVWGRHYRPERNILVKAAGWFHELFTFLDALNNAHRRKHLEYGGDGSMGRLFTRRHVEDEFTSPLLCGASRSGILK